MLTLLGLVALGIVAWHVESLQGKPVFLLLCIAIGVGAPLVRKGRKMTLIRSRTCVQLLV